MKIRLSALLIVLSASGISLAAPEVHSPREKVTTVKTKKTHKHAKPHAKRETALQRIGLKSETQERGKVSLKPSKRKTDVLRANMKDAPSADRHADLRSRLLAEKSQVAARNAMVVAHAESHVEPDAAPLAAAAKNEKSPFLKVDLRSSSPASKDPEPKVKAVPTCNNAPVEFQRGTASERLVLTQCDGTLVGKSHERLSALMQPLETGRDRRDEKGETPKKAVDSRLLYRLQSVAEHFSEQGKTSHIEIVSGYRPGSKGSYHSHARAVDIRLAGVKNEDVVAYCRTLIDTGCGYYPNSSFVHIDARDAGTGHVFWIDASGPNETPRYVATWPETDNKPMPDSPAPVSELPELTKNTPVEVPKVVSPDAN